MYFYHGVAFFGSRVAHLDHHIENKTKGYYSLDYYFRKYLRHCKKLFFLLFVPQLFLVRELLIWKDSFASVCQPF